MAGRERDVKLNHLANAPRGSRAGGGPVISNSLNPPLAATIVTVDASGRILAIEGGAGAMLAGESDGPVIGRDLFRDVAPALNTPACLGRFLDGVRRRHLDDAFTLTYGLETGSVLLDVAMRDGAAPGTFRISLATLRVFAPSRHREAMLAVDQRARSEVVDPTVCEREPIQVPGSIQPPNGLLAADPDTFVVTVASENIADVLGIGLELVLGRTLGEILPDAFVSMLRAELAGGTIPDAAPVRRDLVAGSPPRPFGAMVHRHDGRLVVEFEAVPVRPEDFGAPSPAALRDAVRDLRGRTGLVHLAEGAAAIVRRFTGYERVLVYRFDAEWNGEAVAESIVDGWSERLLGLRFPASDIPRQARELYTRSPTRIVVDRDARPVPLASSGADNRPVDLTFATMRSLSPVHIEYQRNLGVNGSMSMAILVDGRLWGLVIGHHRRPHYVAPETRDAVAVLVDTLALLIRDVETRAVARAHEANLAVEIALLEKIAGAEDFAPALTRGSPKLIDLFGASGAATISGDAVTLVGEAPPIPVVLDLARDLRNRTKPGIGSTVETDRTEDLFPVLLPHREIASGLLAAFVDARGHDILMWFRPEVVAEVAWGGDPNKTILSDERTSAILPRRSFERWIETVRGRSEPWGAWDVEVAETLARAVHAMAVRTSRGMRAMSAKQDELLAVIAQKDVLIEQKDLLTREIDHRVKNSLQIVSAFLRLQARKVGDPEAQLAFEDTYGRVMSIARVHDSLYQSETVTDVDLGQTIEALCRDLAGLGGERRELDLKAERGVMVPYRKAVALCLIATELVTNAWKYAYQGDAGGAIEILVGRHEEGGLKLRVCDQGGGLPPDWRERRRGLGMQLIGAMLTQIEATMDVESTSGACFTIRC